MKEVFEKFIKKANLRFNSKFNYEQFEYVNAKTKSTIVCPVHGAFEQTPDKHLQSKHGCQSCWDEIRAACAVGRVPVCKREPISKEQFLERFKSRHGEKFTLDLSQYEMLNTGKVLLTCPIHGTTSYNPAALLISACGCNQCGMMKKNMSKTLSYENFLEKANTTHQCFYSYPEENSVLYTNRKTIVSIECPKHGLFKKKAQKHLSGQGCFECKIEQLVKDGKLPGGYTNELFEEKPEYRDKEAFVYYLKINNLYKVGITTNLNGRLRAIKSESKHEVEVVDTLKTSLYEAFQIEQFVLDEHDDYRTYRRWSTELFTQNVLNGISLKKCQEHLHTATTPAIPWAMR